MLSVAACATPGDDTAQRSAVQFELAIDMMGRHNDRGIKTLGQELLRDQLRGKFGNKRALRLRARSSSVRNNNAVPGARLHPYYGVTERIY
jgi:hypothetical protein